jgi:hypothetical protein
VTESEGGRRIEANLVGAPAGTGPCTASYTLSVKESKEAVAVAVISHSHGGSLTKGSVACSLVGYLRHATAELAVPLGARVVVDARTIGAAAVTTTHSVSRELGCVAPIPTLRQGRVRRSAPTD